MTRKGGPSLGTVARVRAGATGTGRRRHPGHGVGNGRQQQRVTAPSPQERAVLACVYDVPQRAGEIAARAGLTTGQAANALARMKGKDLVRSTGKGWVRA